MLIAKQVADVLTATRVLIAFLFVWLAVSQGDVALPVAAWLMIASWTTDAFDGPMARRSSVQYHSWLGDHDLEVDMTISIGLLIYMMYAGFLNFVVGLLYILLWGVVFWRLGILRSLGMLVQAPIYGLFLWVVYQHSPLNAYWMLVWIAAAVVLTWPRFPREVIPGFLEGMNGVLERLRAEES